jgi:hypothetical protein
LPVCIQATAHVCVVAREVMGQLGGEFEDDAEGAFEGAGCEYKKEQQFNRKHASSLFNSLLGYKAKLW